MTNFIVDFPVFLCSSVADECLTALRLWLANCGGALLESFGEWVERISKKINNDRGDIVNMMGMVGIAFLTVAIPLIVAVLTMEVSKKKKNYKTLDWNGILASIGNSRWLWALLFVYAPLIVWVFISVHWVLQIFFCAVWVGGIAILFFTIQKIYPWIKEDRIKPRKNYLRSLRNSDNLDEIVKSWHSVWKVKEANAFDDRDFFEIFAQVVDKHLKGDSRKHNTAMKLIENFEVCVENRSAHFLVYFQSVFSKILEWHFSTWKNSFAFETKNASIFASLKYKFPKIFRWLRVKETDEDFYYDGLVTHLSGIVKKIGEKAFEEKRLCPFYSVLNFHIEKRVLASGDENERDQNKRYIREELIPQFFELLLKNLEGRSSYGRTDVWGRIFPRKWKITIENMNNGNYVPELLKKQFFYWAKKRIRKAEEQDYAVNNVMAGLFPNVCPIMWGKILHFWVWKDILSIKELIERPLHFGEPLYLAAMWQKVLLEKLEKNAEGEEKAVALALYLFKGNSDFTEENLENCVNELHKLKISYIDDPNAKFKCEEYFYTFQKLFYARRAEKATE